MKNQENKAPLNQKETKDTKSPGTNHNPNEETQKNDKEFKEKDKLTGDKSDDKGTAKEKADFENPDDDPA